MSERTYFQFRVDGRAFGAAVRARWEDAAGDAVNAGMAVWTGKNSVKLDSQASIERVTVRESTPTTGDHDVR